MKEQIAALAQRELENLYGAGARFRPGQLQAVEAVMQRRRVLVVQRTGWGKSLVYFLCARLFFGQGQGMTLVVTPLLSLMQDQYQSARELGMRCAMLCSLNRQERDMILSDARAGRCELLFVTPETLFSTGVQQTIASLKVALLVLDEAHCISDWGHDFRPNYGRLAQILCRLRPSPHILATTATVDTQVLRDLRGQFGRFSGMLRGTLARPGLALQTVSLPLRSQRYAWIARTLETLPGQGLIYCLSRKECEELAAFLRSIGIKALAYHSGLEKPEEAELAFRENRVRLLVCTIKLGLGYHKPDIGFVIHFQSPASPSAYYQQIGRAGRELSHARAILLRGTEEEKIHRRQRTQAFPDEGLMRRLCLLLRQHPGYALRELSALAELEVQDVERALRFLQFGGVAVEEGGGYRVRRGRLGGYLRHIGAVTAWRERCWEAMQRFGGEEGCLEEALRRSLGDGQAQACGICAHCRPQERLEETVDAQAHHEALRYLSPLPGPLLARTSVGPIRQEGILPGLYLCRRGDAGYAELILQALDTPDGTLPEEIELGCVRILEPLAARYGLDCLCTLPGSDGHMQEDFAQRLADRLQLRRILPPAGVLQSGTHRGALLQGGCVLLLDCFCTDPKPLEVCARALGAAGADRVIPFAVCSLFREKST